MMGFTTWYQQKQMQAKQTPGQKDLQAQQMQMMGRIMPIMLMVFAFNFPSGVVLYWITTNLWTIGQQRLMLRVAPPVVHDKAEKVPVAAKAATADGDTATTPSKPHPSSKKKRKKR
jgi:membrane protein insertase Oxa1/YidC/SpoIIIJ